MLNQDEVPLRLAVLQRVCPGYRVALFEALSEDSALEFRLFIGDDVPGTKVTNARDLGRVRYTKFRSRFIPLPGRFLQWQCGLVDALKEFQPQAILCEGESHFIGYLQAMYYRIRYDPNVALLHWCFTALPGESGDRRDYRAVMKRFFRRFFDAFVAYSTYSRDRLKGEGQSAETIFVATNVGNVGRFLSLSDAIPETKTEARNRLGLPDRFTVLYAGTLDENKRPEVLLELAEQLDRSVYSFVAVGSGPLNGALVAKAQDRQLTNVAFRGRVTENLIWYYRAANVLLLPGRGGIVISEAMAASLPAIVYQCDGTEFDLLHDGITGLLVKDGSAASFAAALESLRNSPALAARMGAAAREQMVERYNEAGMVRSIVQAAQYALRRRRGKTGLHNVPNVS